MFFKKQLVVLTLLFSASNTFGNVTNTLYIDSVVQVVHPEFQIFASLPANFSRIRDNKAEANATKQFQRHAAKFKNAFCTDQVRHLMVYGHMETKRPNFTKTKVSYSNMKGYFIKCSDEGRVAFQPPREL